MSERIDKQVKQFPSSTRPRETHVISGSPTVDAFHRVQAGVSRPSKETLTPHIVQLLQPLCGNRYVTRLVQRSTEGESTLPVIKQTDLFGGLINLKRVKVERGTPVPSHWKFLEFDDVYDYYDDGEPEPYLQQAVETWDNAIEDERAWLMTEQMNDVDILTVESMFDHFGAENPRNPQNAIEDKDELDDFRMDVASAQDQFKVIAEGLMSEEATYDVDEEHLRLRKGLGRGVKRLSENQVHASIRLEVTGDTGRNRSVDYTIPETFSSGGFPPKLRNKVIAWLVLHGIINDEGDFSDERHAHSEQEMVIYFTENLQVLLGKLIDQLLPGDVVRQFVLDIVSIPNTVCTPCHRSLDKLIETEIAPQLQVLLGTKILPKCQLLINATAEKKFSGGFPAEGGDTAQWNEKVSLLGSKRKKRKPQLEMFERQERQTNVLETVEVEVGETYDFNLSGSSRRIGQIESGMEFELGGRRWKVLRVEAPWAKLKRLK